MLRKLEIHLEDARSPLEEAEVLAASMGLPGTHHEIRRALRAVLDCLGEIASKREPEFAPYR